MEHREPLDVAAESPCRFDGRLLLLIWGPTLRTFERQHMMHLHHSAVLRIVQRNHV
jgi:hypothetical protein